MAEEVTGETVYCFLTSRVMFKRAFDISISAVGLIVLLPLFLVVAVLIKLDSKGPVLFRQKRIGKDGKPFDVLKFRTMIVGAQEKGPKITGRNDARVTQIGHVLRWLKIDELPQLVNVLKGEMSLVGPRPELPSVVDLYTDEQRQVLSVKPGIVGPSQIVLRNELERFPEGVQTEEYYIEHILPEKLSTDLQYVKDARLLNDIKYFFLGLKVTIFGSFKVQTILESKRRIAFLCQDILFSCLSYYLAYNLRFEWDIPGKEFSNLLTCLPIIVLFRSVIFIYFGLYRNVWEYTDARDLSLVVKSVSFSTCLIVLTAFITGLQSHSRSVFIIDWALLMSFVSGSRLLVGVYSHKKHGSQRRKRNVLIVGAGSAGESLLHELNYRCAHVYNPVGFIDDDPKKTRMSIHGLRVLGKRYDIPQVVSLKTVDDVFIAISNITSKDIQAIAGFCEKAGVRYRIVPSATDLLSGKVRISDVKAVEIDDLLGRKPVTLDFEAISEFIRAKRIFVTGAGGSIGSELCRQVLEYNPAHLVLIDKNENYLYEIRQELQSKLNGVNASFHLCDITGERKTEKLFDRYRPQAVFHAAAYKHVPLIEENRDEAVTNNIYGTRLLADLSHWYAVEQFVLVSTDKAVNPTSFMGATKRVAETYVQGLSKLSETKFITVRFGNVLNSKGSVVPLFMKQIEKGGPVTVTHPEAERYFMTIPEAVQLILQSAAMGNSGEIFVLDMGQPVKIVDLAMEMINLSPFLWKEDIRIEFTGLRPGEKLFEELAIDGEALLPTRHSNIKVLKSLENNFHALCQDIEDLCRSVADMDPQTLALRLRELVPDYRPWNGEALAPPPQPTEGKGRLRTVPLLWASPPGASST